MVESWIKEELEQVELRAQQSAFQKGLVRYWKAPEGKSDIEVLVEKPAQVSVKFPDKTEIFIKIGDVEYVWSISRKSPLYQDLIIALNKGAVKFEVIRIGTDAKDTRYRLKIL